MPCALHIALQVCTSHVSYNTSIFRATAGLSFARELSVPPIDLCRCCCIPLYLLVQMFTMSMTKHHSTVQPVRSLWISFFSATPISLLSYRIKRSVFWGGAGAHVLSENKLQYFYSNSATPLTVEERLTLGSLPLRAIRCAGLNASCRTPDKSYLMRLGPQVRLRYVDA